MNSGRRGLPLRTRRLWTGGWSKDRLHRRQRNLERIVRVKREVFPGVERFDLLAKQVTSDRALGVARKNRDRQFAQHHRERELAAIRANIPAVLSLHAAPSRAASRESIGGSLVP